jgi:hypothetical protein
VRAGARRRRPRSPRKPLRWLRRADPRHRESAHDPGGDDRRVRGGARSGGRGRHHRHRPAFRRGHGARLHDDGEKIFPKCIKDPASHRTVVKAGEAVTIRFTGVEPGKYAVALLHDENDNGKADRALGMMPKEGYGFSRDAPVRMAPPKFRDAVFEHKTGRQDIAITMRYFL